MCIRDRIGITSEPPGEKDAFPRKVLRNASLLFLFAYALLVLVLLIIDNPDSPLAIRIGRSVALLNVAIWFLMAVVADYVKKLDLLSRVHYFAKYALITFVAGGLLVLISFAFSNDPSREAMLWSYIVSNVAGIVIFTALILLFLGVRVVWLGADDSHIDKNKGSGLFD